ncbi:pectinesterase PPME1 [Hibiscus syriacus]|uniref:Pectinesterase PPME1 n=1 Tax=Hibiscus syriacus TaxID=106335 RepID=A0A6A2XCU7_HIBSY|nr:pectinesterase PPME1 [Hibiscus syriacus]
MLVGIPNVGKSALANSLHQIGRISAAEKGKLKHATVSPQLGETKDISSLKDLVVHDVRGAIFDTISSFDGNPELEDDMIKLFETQSVALRVAFRVPEDVGENVCNKVGVKLLDLYRTGSFGIIVLIPCLYLLHDPFQTIPTIINRGVN